ncbi:MAG: hypothetical protein FWB93_00735 [Oscillospiraceae bacterium]|nr:hypothetical protein [Oscillospiraceae bacterium]
MWITEITYKLENQAAKMGLIYRLSERYYRNVVDKEIQLASIDQNDRILCVGGGICPLTAILFHQKTGAAVTVIDNNEGCVQKAQEVIAHLGIGEYVTVLHQEGSATDVAFANYTVVHLALQISEMDKVFSSIEEQVAPGTKLLVRRPKKHLCCIYSNFFDGVKLRCSSITHSFRNIGKTVLYTKQDVSL